MQHRANVASLRLSPHLKDAVGPLLPFIGPSSAAVQLHQTGHSYIV
jgi:hypothetical protein